jgi:hypothetical protein
MEYYKKVDKSLFRYGTSIPKKRLKEFTYNKIPKVGTSRPVKLIWKKKKKVFDVSLLNIKRTKSTSVCHIRWDNNEELQLALKKEFIQSYLAIVSRDYENAIEGKYYKTDLLGGNQEVLIFRSINSEEIELETFIKIETPYDNTFKRLVDENVFGWMSKKDNDYLITYSSPWYNKIELVKHKDANYVVYYLLDDDNKEIYIGSAFKLGDRVKDGRKEIPYWTKFRYDIIHPKYHHLIRRIEFHTIRAFAGFFDNKGKMKHFPVSTYKLVNKNWPKRLS